MSYLCGAHSHWKLSSHNGDSGVGLIGEGMNLALNFLSVVISPTEITAIKLFIEGLLFFINELYLAALLVFNILMLSWI